MSGLHSFIQNPLFAPASVQRDQANQGDDFDVNEIFADYFINEFDDPLNAYTSSMANYSGGVVSVSNSQGQGQVQAGQIHGGQAQQQNTAAAGLPTSGIKTQFGNMVHQQPLKKARHEGPLIHPAAMGAAGGIGNNFGGAGIVSGAAAVAAAASAGAGSGAAGGRVALPVGVGIRMGGIGGVSPATAQSSDRTLHGQMMWDGNLDAGGGQSGMSDQAIAERRQRNREHAKRSRVRKKFMLESLQEQVLQLQKENKDLRLIIQEHMPENAQEIIAECCSKNPLFADPENEDDQANTKLVRADLSLMESLSASQQNFVLSDPRLPDNPIVFASPGFYKMTGYTPKEVLGRNCRFLQGPGTDTKTLDAVRKAISIGADATVCILNYKANGTPFWNQFFVAALRDSDNNIVNYVGVQCEVEPEAGASALEDRVNEVLPLQNKEDEA